MILAIEAESLADDTFFNARLRVRVLEVKYSSKKSVFGENRLAVRLFEVKKSSIESSIGGKPTSCSTFRAKKSSIESSIGEKPTPRSTFRGKKLSIGLSIERNCFSHAVQQIRRCLLRQRLMFRFKSNNQPSIQ